MRGGSGAVYNLSQSGRVMRHRISRIRRYAGLSMSVSDDDAVSHRAEPPESVAGVNLHRQPEPEGLSAADGPVCLLWSEYRSQRGHIRTVPLMIAFGMAMRGVLADDLIQYLSPEEDQISDVLRAAPHAIANACQILSRRRNFFSQHGILSNFLSSQTRE